MNEQRTPSSRSSARRHQHAGATAPLLQDGSTSSAASSPLPAQPASSDDGNCSGSSHSSGNNPDHVPTSAFAHSLSRYSWWSRLSFSWVSPLQSAGEARGWLEDSDVPELEGSDRTEWLEGHFLTNWEKQKEKARMITQQQNEAARLCGRPPPPPAQPSLFRALWPLLGWRYAFQGLLKLVSDCLMFSGPVLLGYLVSFVESYHPPDSAPGSAPPKPPETAWHGYAYATALVLGVLLNAVFSSQYNFRIRRIGLSLRACVVTGVYRHALRQSARGRGQFSSGTLTNVMSTDTERVMDVAVSVHELWSLPIQIGLALFLLYAQVGLALLAGLVVVLLLMPLNAWITRRIARVSAAMMRAKDRRLELINELVRGVRVIKLHALESRFEKAILREREQEIKQLKYRKYFDALCVYFWATTPILVSLVTFACYSYLLHRPLTSARVFSSLSLFNILIRPLNAFPWVINGLVEGRVSVRRVYAFLVSEERREEEKQARRPRKVEEFTLQPQLSAQHHPNATSYVSVLLGGTHDEHECALCVQGSFDFVPAPEDEKEKTKPKAQLPPMEHDDALKENKQQKQHKQSSPPLEMQVKSPSPLPASVHALHAVSLHIRRGESVLLHGRVGVGKSTLLLALLGELVPVGDPRTESFRCVNLNNQTPADGDEPSTASGAMAFVGQQDVWLPNATVREVILCFAPFDAALYERVLFACALGPDLASWPAGDRTEVGEAGVNVSGGQRVRLALARACYAAAAGTVQAVLLDDPLAAVDAHVAAHLVRHVLSDDEGLLGARNCNSRGRGGITRVLVTHQVRLLRPHVHRLLEMSGGHIVREEDGGLRLRMQSGGVVDAGESESDVEHGNAEERKSSAVDVASSSLSPQPRPSSLPLASDAALSPSSAGIGVARSSPSANGSDPADNASGLSNGDSDDLVASPAVADAVADDAASMAAAAAAELAAERALLEKGFLTVEESRARGSIRSKVLRVYLLDFVGGPLCALILLSMVLMQASRNGSDWWLSYWVQQTTSAERDGDGGGSDGELSEGRAHYYLRIYAYLAGANSLAALFRSFIFAYGGLVAAEALFRRLLRRVLAAPVSFFDSQPQGRLTNRFSSDIYSVDENIPFQANILLAVLFSLMGSLVVIAMVVPVVLVLLPVLGIAYARMQRLYRSVSREVRRLDSVSRSPLYARFVEAIAGAVSIRAMQLSKPLRARTRATLDRNQKIQFVGLGLSQWLNIRLQLVGVSMIMLVSILAVLSCVYPELDRSKYTSWLLNPSLVGLAIAYALPLTDNLNGLISTATDTEKEVVSVERTIEYMEVRGEEEADDGAEGTESQAEERQQNGVHLSSSDDDCHEYDEDLEAGLSQARDGHRSLKLTSSPKTKTKQKHASINEDLQAALLPESPPPLSSVSPSAAVHHGSSGAGIIHRARGRIAASPAGWPSRGEVSFRSVTLRYRTGLDPALRGVNLHVPAGSKVGIVGRTGSGKSSLTQVLFGMYPMERGSSIVVDGIDLATVSKREWRRRVAIIPQTPVLFSGTLRSNLLPYEEEDEGDDNDDESSSEKRSGGSHRFESVSDEELWRVLAECHMEPRVRSLPLGLDTVLSSSLRLSGGEQQLLCFARALLKKAKLLVLDEATASVDLSTDALIQELTLRLPSTVLLIAHRLSSVLELDQVVVMDSGRIVEQGPPKLLAQQQGSMFAQLLQRAQEQQRIERHT